MKVSEAIKALEEVLQTDGDLEIIHMEEVDGRFYMEWGRTFEVIGVPIGEPEDEMKLHAVVAFMNHECGVPEDGEPEPEAPKLRKVKG